MPVEDFDEDVQAAAWDLLTREREFIPTHDDEAKHAYIQRICTIHGVEGREGEVIRCMSAIITESLSPVLEFLRSWMTEVTDQMNEFAAALTEVFVPLDEPEEGE